MYGSIFKGAQQVRQDEDSNFNGKIDARYLFKDGKVTEQKRVSDLAPDETPRAFTTIQEELVRKVDSEKSEKENSIVKATQESLAAEPRSE